MFRSHNFSIRKRDGDASFYIAHSQSNGILHTSSLSHSLSRVSSPEFSISSHKLNEGWMELSHSILLGDVKECSYITNWTERRIVECNQKDLFDVSGSIWLRVTQTECLFQRLPMHRRHSFVIQLTKRLAWKREIELLASWRRQVLCLAELKKKKPRNIFVAISLRLIYVVAYQPRRFQLFSRFTKIEQKFVCLKRQSLNSVNESQCFWL